VASSGEYEYELEYCMNIPFLKFKYGNQNKQLKGNIKCKLNDLQ